MEFKIASEDHHSRSVGLPNGTLFVVCNNCLDNFIEYELKTSSLGVHFQTIEYEIS